MSARIEIKGDCVKVQEESDESYMEILPSDLSQEDIVALKEWLNKVSLNLNCCIGCMGTAGCTDMTDMHRADKWPVKELTMQCIRDIAEYKGLSLEGVDILDVVSSVEKGVEVALENWNQIVTEAIINAKARKCARRRYHVI